MASFIPRAVFPTLDSLPRSYYLGHHAAGLSKMRTMLSQIDLIVECRDFRVPFTSTNPLFEEALSGKERLVVYTKHDLGGEGREPDVERSNVLRKHHHPAHVLFSDHKDRRNVKSILKHIKQSTTARDNLTGSHVMVVGMPNVGKSSLLNALRREGVGKGKVAHTGAQPGVTRKIARSGVKIVDSKLGGGNGGDVYLLDTPGVFIPYVPDAEAMLKLALCGSVKDTIITPVTLADYLLFHINKHQPTRYEEYCQPTNDIQEMLDAMARKTGRLQKGGSPDLEASALWMVQRWRTGHLGKFVLDELTKDSLGRHSVSEPTQMSLNQARKASKEMTRVKTEARRTNASAIV